MAYHIYTTRAYVCGNYNRNTSDRFFFLFTREAGMVLATARSVREERSKHRNALQDFSLLTVSLVRGRAAWRVTGTAAQQNVYFATDDREIRGAVLRTTQLLRRLVRGEEKHDALFDYIIGGLDALVTNSVFAPQLYERVLALKALHMLGYVAPHDLTDAVISAPDATAACRAAGHSKTRARIERTIEHALELSHL